MTTEKENTDIFNAKLLAERNVNGVVFRLYSNAIFHVSVPRFEKITMAMVAEGYRFLDDNGGGEFYNIFQFDSFSDVDPEVREWAADSSGNSYTITDAIVIGSFAQKIITDFYLRINKPIRPTKIFFSLEKAHQWTVDLGKLKK